MKYTVYTQHKNAQRIMNLINNVFSDSVVDGATFNKSSDHLTAISVTTNWSLEQLARNLRDNDAVFLEILPDLSAYKTYTLFTTGTNFGEEDEDFLVTVSSIMDIEPWVRASNFNRFVFKSYQDHNEIIRNLPGNIKVYALLEGQYELQDGNFIKKQ